MFIKLGVHKTLPQSRIPNSSGRSKTTVAFVGKRHLDEKFLNMKTFTVVNPNLCQQHLLGCAKRLEYHYHRISHHWEILDHITSPELVSSGAAAIPISSKTRVSDISDALVECSSAWSRSEGSQFASPCTLQENPIVTHLKPHPPVPP